MAIDDIRIETERLILRPPNGDDFEGWAAFQADEATMTYIGGVKSRAESWRVLCAMVGAWHVRGSFSRTAVSGSAGSDPGIPKAGPRRKWAGLSRPNLPGRAMRWKQRLRV
jgi:RimJ/RimL family protein N-acetyltransferase